MSKVIALDPTSTFTYVLDCQKDDPVEEQVRWELKVLTSREEEFIDNKLGFSRDGDFHINLGTQGRIALDIALIGVENFLDANGNEVKIERQSKKESGKFFPLKDSFVDKIPKELRKELIAVIMNGGPIDEDIASKEDEEAKN